MKDFELTPTFLRQFQLFINQLKFSFQGSDIFTGLSTTISLTFFKIQDFLLRKL